MSAVFLASLDVFCTYLIQTCVNRLLGLCFLLWSSNLQNIEPPWSLIHGEASHDLRGYFQCFVYGLRTVLISVDFHGTSNVDY
jgi:hypothetical protein